MSKINSAIAGATAGGSVGGPWGAAIGGVGGFLLGQDDNSSDYYAEMLEEAKRIPLPLLKEYYPEMYHQVVSLNPELEQAVSLGPSEMAGIATDPGLRQTQLKALNRLSEIGDAGGMDAQFLADQNRLETDINTNLQGQTGAITQNMAAKGMSGGMSELVAKNIATQNSANRQAQMGMDAKAQAEQRALQALMQSGQLAGQMQGQDFRQASSKAQAADAISKFNAANTQGVNQRNVGYKNDAQSWNANNAQGVANQNTGLRNDAQLHNSNLAQQQYENELRKRGLINSAANNSAENSYKRSKDQDQFIGGLINAGATAYAGSKR